MVQATPGIVPIESPDGWRTHQFGLPEVRWAALRGRNFWITGAGTGFGRSIAVALAAAGATVFLSGRRADKLDETIDEIAAVGIGSETCRVLPVDITDPGAVTAAAEVIKAGCEPLYGLVNCAALPEPAAGPWPLADATEDAWNTVMATNVTGQWNVARAALPLMLGGDGVRILFMTSEAGWAFTPGMGPYNVSKAALNNLAASFATECAARYPQKDMQINALVPGEARTEMNQGSDESPYIVVPMALMLLSHPPGGPNGKFFHRDGRHLTFAYAQAYDKMLLLIEAERSSEEAAGRDEPSAITPVRRLGLSFW